eukprot:scaffold562944_cov17-Prasinocladus_malaysianus.AAC.1
MHQFHHCSLVNSMPLGKPGWANFNTVFYAENCLPQRLKNHTFKTIVIVKVILEHIPSISRHRCPE